MATLEQKVKLLAIVRGDEDQELLEILNQVVTELGVIRASIPQPVDLSGVSDEIVSLNVSYTNLVKDINKFKDKVNVSFDKIETVSRDEVKDTIKDELKDILDKVEKLSKQVKNRGGGSPHRLIQVSGTNISTRYADINIIPVGVTVSAADNNTTKMVDLTITGGSGSGVNIEIPPETPNGTFGTFTFVNTPKVIVVDQGRTMREGVGWNYAAPTATLDVFPNFDIYSIY